MKKHKKMCFLDPKALTQRVRKKSWPVKKYKTIAATQDALNNIHYIIQNNTVSLN